MSRYLFTSESVSEGHPDKICDQISDAVLDAALTGDPKSRVACETLIKTGFVVVAGEITTSTWMDFGAIARGVIKDVGYDSSEKGFDYQTCGVLVAIEPQSADISQGVTEGQGLHAEQGAGDQGLMFGYACDETPELMPAAIMYSHALTRRMAEVRKSGKLSWLRPDSKSQVTVEYDGDRVARIESVVVSTQHAPEVTHEQIVEGIQELVIKKSLPKKLLDAKTKYYINPTGRFVIGGPYGDAGLTGRKIIVDSYGGMGRHGGGAFSGKDPSKVDRSAAYYARYVAKNLVAAKVARRAEVQIAYAIGVARPMGVYVNTFGTSKVSEDTIQRYVQDTFDMRPKAIIDELGLLAPIYRPTATYGHFGRKEFAWEKTHRAKRIAADLARKVWAVPTGDTAPAAKAAPAKPAAVAAPKAAPAKAPKAAPAKAPKAAPAKAPKAAPAKAPKAAKARKPAPAPKATRAKVVAAPKGAARARSSARRAARRGRRA